MTFPALPLHCRSGFSRDAFHQSHQSIGLERPPTETIRNRTGNFDDVSRAAAPLQERLQPRCFPSFAPEASGVNALLQRAFETGPGISMTFPALPLHCRSGFSRDAFRHSHQKHRA
jgi:hypothetical protein